MLLADLSPASDGTMIQRAGSAAGGCAHPHRHGSSGWEKHRKMEGQDCKWPLLLEFSPLPPVCACVCACVCVSVSVCESVREEGTFSSQPPAAFAFTRETRQPDLFFFCFFCASCWKEKGKRTAVIFFFLFFLPFCFFHCGCYLHTYIYVRWNSWQAKGASRRVGCRMAHYKDVSVRKTSLNLVTGFFQYLRGK